MQTKQSYPAHARCLTAGSLRQQQQQQISSVASSLAAAVQPAQPPTVHIERVELSANLRVAGDDASDSTRRKRAKRNEFEQWQRVKGMGNINLLEGGQPVALAMLVSFVSTDQYSDNTQVYI